MNYFDCNAFIGRPARREIFLPAPTAVDILSEMDYCGVEKALVWHAAQLDASQQAGNELLTAAIQSQPRLYGCMTIMPNQAKEFPPFEEFNKIMRQSRMVALRAFPIDHHYLLNRIAMDSWLEPIITRRIPLILSVAYGCNWDIIYSLLADFPDLVCIICDHGCWGEDRRFRPLIENFANVYIDTANYLLDGGIEAFVERYGPERILFGSGFPRSHFGGMMMAIQHAQISDQARSAIAGGNLSRIIEEVLW